MHRTVVVDLRDGEHVLVPIDLVVLGALRIQLLAEGERDGVLAGVVGPTQAVQVAHRQVDHPAMAPKPPRVDREPRRQQPHLRGHRRHAAVVVDPERAEPELRPRGSVQHAAVLPDEVAALHASGILPGRPEKAQGDVVQDAAEHRAWRLDVRAPTAVDLLVVADVGLGRPPEVFRQHLVQARGDVGSNDEAGEKKVWAAVVAGPLAVVALEHLVKCEALSRGVEGVRGLVSLVGPRALPILQLRSTEDAIACVRVLRGVELEGLLGRGSAGVEGPDLLPRNLVRQDVLLRLRLLPREPPLFHPLLDAGREARLGLQLAVLRDRVPRVGVRSALPMDDAV
mmetsp:Transcript_22789/g.65689  ORF Transcript_22789/g.65689 Transcript_22789/m.65689 type:complete len:340 (+) Transcript_22789:1455-2474(+)